MTLQRKKNLRLLLILSVLSLLTVGVYLWGGSGSGMDADKDLFLIADVSTIDEVRITYPDGKELKLSYAVSGWKVNDTTDADRARIEVLFAVLNQVKVRRPVGRSQQEEVSGRLEKEGVRVFLYESGKLLRSFSAGGSQEKDLAYFQALGGESPIPYIVHIPGYQSYLSGIFEMDPREWKERLVFAGTNWSTLERVSVRYPGGEPKDSTAGFDIVYDDRNYTVEQLEEVDTARLYDFLDNISYLQVYQYIDPKDDPRQDSLSRLGPNAVIRVADLGRESVDLSFFPHGRGDRYVLGNIDSLDWALFDADRVRKLIKRRSDFRKKAG